MRGKGRGGRAVVRSKGQAATTATANQPRLTDSLRPDPPPSKKFLQLVGVLAVAQKVLYYYPAVQRLPKFNARN